MSYAPIVWAGDRRAHVARSAVGRAQLHVIEAEDVLASTKQKEASEYAHVVPILAGLLAASS
jgi:hypothetical protein